MISVEDVEHAYATKNQGTSYLRDINIEINEGEIYGIIGKAGNGKTTLLRCLKLLEKPLSGRIKINNVDIARLSNKDLIDMQRTISLIQQNTELLENSNVYANVALPLQVQNVAKKELQTRVGHILTITGLSEKAHLYPCNLNTSQKQRVAIARALITNPKILLCDEITNGMDHKTTQSIISLLQEINYEFKLTIVMVTHDIEIIKNLCNRIAIMHQGKIIEQTTPEKLFLSPKTDIAKDYIRATSRMEMPWSYRRRLKLNYFEQSHPLIRLTFTGDIAPELIISNIIEKYNLQIVIIQGYQEQVAKNNINVIMTEIQGEIANIEQAFDFLSENGFNTEVLGYVDDIV